MFNNWAKYSSMVDSPCHYCKGQKKKEKRKQETNNTEECIGEKPTYQMTWSPFGLLSWLNNWLRTS